MGPSRREMIENFGLETSVKKLRSLDNIEMDFT
jgi:hypothetical protein